MATPKYVVKRIGNDYKIIRTDAEGVISLGAWVAGGGLLALMGLRSRGLFGLMKMAAGAGLIYYGLTGNNPIKAIQESCGCSKELTTNPGATHQHDEQASSSQAPQDEVDEASMESFPASDAPAHTRSTSTEVVA